VSNFSSRRSSRALRLLQSPAALCPGSQSLARAEWVEKRTSEVLDTHYFHVVFTIPEQVASIAYQNKDLVYGILFRATAETLSTIAADDSSDAIQDVSNILLAKA
jgi:hypothetical protein